MRGGESDKRGQTRIMRRGKASGCDRFWQREVGQLWYLSPRRGSV